MKEKIPTVLSRFFEGNDPNLIDVWGFTAGKNSWGYGMNKDDPGGQREGLLTKAKNSWEFAKTFPLTTVISKNHEK